jgi:curved DNA binding protein
MCVCVCPIRCSEYFACVCCDWTQTCVLHAQVKATFTAENPDRGVAFPTCISVNNCVAHFCPTSDHPAVLAVGDVVKVEMAAHVDGYIVTQAHTIVCGPHPELPLTARAADAVCAAYLAAEIALRMLQPGAAGRDITAAIHQVAAHFHVAPMVAMSTRRLRQFVLDGDKIIPGGVDKDQPFESAAVVEVQDVFAIDVAMSTGSGSAQEATTERATVYRRNLHQHYNLKLHAARAMYAEVTRRFPALPFSLSMMSDEKTARYGSGECEKHNLFEIYPVFFERAGETVAHFKMTAVVDAAGPRRLSAALPPPFVHSVWNLPESLAAILARPVRGPSVGQLPAQVGLATVCAAAGLAAPVPAAAVSDAVAMSTE